MSAIIERTVINLQEFNTGYWNLKIVPCVSNSVGDNLMSYNTAYFFSAVDEKPICASGFGMGSRPRE